MGKKEQNDLRAVSDLLAEIIAFLVTYKSEIQQAYNEITKKADEDLKGDWVYDYYSKEEIEAAFSKIKKEKKKPLDILVDTYPLLLSLDRLIEVCLNKCIENASTRTSRRKKDVFINGINSLDSQKSTRLMILPRWITMWEGSGEDREVESESFNRFLKHARYLSIDGAYSEKKYQVNCVFLHKLKAAHPDLYKEGEKSLIIGMSPISCNFKLKDKNKKSEGLYLPKPWGKKDKEKIRKKVIDAINSAEKEHVNLLVFPEMLGYDGLKDEIRDYFNVNSFEYLKLVVLPSVWEIVDEKGTNTSYLIRTCDGIEVLKQGKLVAFNDRKDRKLEALIPDNTLNLLYDEVHGCMGILICRGALETKVRNLVIDDLGVKLLVVPSWSPEEFSFKRALPSANDMNCNMIWNNTCSALSCENDDELKQRVVCMMTQVCKDPGIGDRELKEFHPIAQCNKECLKDGTCLFTGDLRGVIKNERDKKGKKTH